MLRNRKRMAVCITLLCVNLCFIWGNSLLPGEISGAISGWLRELLLGAAPEGPDVGHGLLRKLAHFTEFACFMAFPHEGFYHPNVGNAFLHRGV